MGRTPHLTDQEVIRLIRGLLEDGYTTHRGLHRLHTMGLRVGRGRFYRLWQETDRPQRQRRST